MYGIDVNERIDYKLASLRYFERDERHVSRFCSDNVLLMVFDGVLRFRENGRDFEIGPGQYHIQHKDTVQEGPQVSDSPKYLYVHFDAQWREGADVLAPYGRFDVGELRERMTRLDRLAGGGACLLELNAAFYELLSILYKGSRTRSVAEQIAGYLAAGRRRELDLDEVAEHFHFSKNHIINIFKAEYSLTPMEYVIGLRVRDAEWLLESTAASVEDIAYECGFNSYSNFYRQFSARQGCSPALWRKARRAGEDSEKK